MGDRAGVQEPASKKSFERFLLVKLVSNVLMKFQVHSPEETTYKMFPDENVIVLESGSAGTIRGWTHQGQEFAFGVSLPQILAPGFTKPHAFMLGLAPKSTVSKANGSSTASAHYYR